MQVMARRSKKTYKDGIPLYLMGDGGDEGYQVEDDGAKQKH